MILTMTEAFTALRTEENDGNRDIVTGLLLAIPSYITTTTGIADPVAAATVEGDTENPEPGPFPLVKTLAKFLLCLWYNPDGTDAVQLQVVVNNLLKTLKAMAPTINSVLGAK